MWSKGCRVALAYMNRGRQAHKVNQFTAQDDRTEIHSVDNPSQCGRPARPVHSWPGSSYEFYPLVRQLKNSTPLFHQAASRQGLQLC